MSVRFTITCYPERWVLVEAEVFNHPRPRSAKQWRADIAAARADAMVVLDALTSGVIYEHPTLYDLIPWLVRCAIEERRLDRTTAMPKRTRTPHAWITRPRYRPRRARGLCDVYCLFCHEPLACSMHERSWLPPYERIDYSRHPEVKKHTPRCALIHLAGLRAYAPWGSVSYPDPEVAA